MKEEIKNQILEILERVGDERSKEPNQYVVGYFRKDNQELIGYHLDSFCNIGKDILQAKRYSGENPYGQLTTIWLNIKHILGEYLHEGGFGSILNIIREKFEGLSLEDIYIDAIYLAEDTPYQRRNYTII